jgi:hypothetical protein
MNAEQEPGLETPALWTSIARDVAAIRINRDGEESFVAALEKRYAWTVSVSACMANAITAKRSCC